MQSRTIRSLSRLNQKLLHEISLLENSIPTSQRTLARKFQRVKERAKRVHGRIQFLSTRSLDPINR